MDVNKNIYVQLFFISHKSPVIKNDKRYFTYPIYKSDQDLPYFKVATKLFNSGKEIDQDGNTIFTLIVNRDDH